MNTVAANSSRVGARYRTFVAVVVAVVVFIVLVLRWATYGPYHNPQPIESAAVYGQLVHLELKAISNGNQEAEMILGNGDAGVRGGDEFDVTIPEELVPQAEEYLKSGVSVVVRYYSPWYYWRSESEWGNIATSIEPAK